MLFKADGYKGAGFVADIVAERLIRIGTARVPGFEIFIYIALKGAVPGIGEVHIRGGVALVLILVPDLEKFGQVDAIAGVATGAIPQGALVAEELNLPFVYVRSTPKDHGLENLIEGELRPGMKVVVIEDLISTGGSSLKAVEAIRRDGCEVIGMVAAFTYGFPVAIEAFKEAKVNLVTLTNYEAVLDSALKTGYINEEDVPVLDNWRKDPAHWEAGK